MGSVRRILPRLVVLGAAAAGITILLSARSADADVPVSDPVGDLGGAVSSLLPSQSPPLELPLPNLSAVVPAVAQPVQQLTANLEPTLTAVVEPAQTLFTPPQPSTQVAAAELEKTNGLPTTLAGALSPPTLPAATVDGLTVLTTPLTGSLARDPISFSTLAPLAFEPPYVGAVALPALVSALPEGTSLPGPQPIPLPADPTGALVRPATGPTTTSNPSGSGATGPTYAATFSSSPSTGTSSTDAESIPPDPGGSSGPARAPPPDAPRDPPHRGSTDHASHDYWALPGTDRIGVTRGESWHAGTDVEMSHTPPEPSVSPD